VRALEAGIVEHGEDVGARSSIDQSPSGRSESPVPRLSSTIARRPAAGGDVR